MIFLTVTERFLDNNGIWRYEYVSWPVFRTVEGIPTYYVKDIDNSEFECDMRNCIISEYPSRLINVSPEEYKELSLVPPVSDYNALYKQFGIDQDVNTHAQHEGGEFDVNKKMKLINEIDYGKSERNPILKRNLSITD